MDVGDLLEQVHDRESFFAFVRALVADRRAAVSAEQRRPTDPRGPGPDAGGWYNVTIEAYLRKTKTALWIEHDFPANARLRKAPQYYE